MVEKKVPRQIPPQDNVWFVLVLEPTDAIDIVDCTSYKRDGWRYKGPLVTSTQRKRVKLIRLGIVRDQTEAETEAAKQGLKPVIGHWIKAFRNAFPSNDGEGHIHFAGRESVWMDPNGIPRYPVLCEFNDGWIPDFDWSEGLHFVHSRWLVEVL